MCLLNFVLYFRINYRCDFGEAVYVVGNIPQLGNWNPAQALKLKWAEGHNWTQKLELIHDNTKLIEYKYIVASDTITLPLTNIRWENGSNHFLNLLTTSNLSVILNDEWECLKIKVALRYDTLYRNLDHLTIKKVIFLTDLDTSPNKLPMVLEKGLIDWEISKGWFWTVSFKVSSSICSFRYKYKMEAENAKKIMIEPEENEFVLSQARESLDPNKAYMIKGSTLVKSDCNLTSSLNHSPITEDIMLGASPKHSAHVNHLYILGVTGVLNLQTLDDMEKCGTDWESLQGLYKKVGIKVKHFPISDMNIEDLTLKMREAVDLLHELLGSEKEKVYVHCTAGRFRSPNIVVFYLCRYRNYAPNKAIELIRSRRSKTKIIKEKVFERHIG